MSTTLICCAAAVIFSEVCVPVCRKMLGWVDYMYHVSWIMWIARGVHGFTTVLSYTHSYKEIPVTLQ